MPVAETVTIKPDLRVIHPEYGDMTEDVARALAEIRQEDNERLYHEARARQVALRQATPAEGVRSGNLNIKAVIDPGVHAYWRMREGKGFWKHELDWFIKRHPEVRVKTQALNPTVRVDGFRGRTGPVGRRGRWAL